MTPHFSIGVAQVVVDFWGDFNIRFARDSRSKLGCRKVPAVVRTPSVVVEFPKAGRGELKEASEIVDLLGGGLLGQNSAKI